MTTNRIVRNLVVQTWGTPHTTIGSVNEPRETEEHGQRFNEKWVYRFSHPGPGRPKERVIYWLRYDFVGSYLVNADGSVTPEDLSRTIAGVPDRLYRPAKVSAS